MSTRPADDWLSRKLRMALGRGARKEFIAGDSGYRDFLLAARPAQIPVRCSMQADTHALYRSWSAPAQPTAVGSRNATLRIRSGCFLRGAVAVSPRPRLDMNFALGQRDLECKERALRERPIPTIENSRAGTFYRRSSMLLMIRLDRLRWVTRWFDTVRHRSKSPLKCRTSGF